jgi:NAD kinase
MVQNNLAIWAFGLNGKIREKSTHKCDKYGSIFRFTIRFDYIIQEHFLLSHEIHGESRFNSNYHVTNEARIDPKAMR